MEKFRARWNPIYCHFGPQPVRLDHYNVHFMILQRTMVNKVNKVLHAE